MPDSPQLARAAPKLARHNQDTNLGPPAAHLSIVRAHQGEWDWSLSQLPQKPVHLGFVLGV